jgi:hypothetical protein
MPLGQAFVIASGVVLAVFGFLYMAWRSTGPDKTASILRALFSALSASILVGIGTVLLLVSEPNTLMGLGMAIGAYTSALKTAFIGWHDHRGRVPSHSTFKALFRVYPLGNLVAGCLFGIGCLVYGGPLGVLGASASLCWAAMHLWLLKRVTAEGANRAERST